MLVREGWREREGVWMRMQQECQEQSWEGCGLVLPTPHLPLFPAYISCCMLPTLLPVPTHATHPHSRWCAPIADQLYFSLQHCPHPHDQTPGIHHIGDDSVQVPGSPASTSDVPASFEPDLSQVTQSTQKLQLHLAQMCLRLSPNLVTPAPASSPTPPG